jgi:16S rRNA (guanine527-N7)-methyltransferase
MTLLSSEAEARAWIASWPSVSRETVARLERFATLLAAANDRQNLVAASTLGAAFWVRHLADSAQLLPLAPAAGGRWVDLGSGPGLPGVVIAILAPHWQITLVESRRLRCEFLREAVVALGLEAQITVAQQRVEAHSGTPYDVISARAYAPLPDLLQSARHLAQKTTVWLLPKGKNAVNELSTVPEAWQNRFHVEPSRTDSEAGILIGTGSFR